MRTRTKIVIITLIAILLPVIYVDFIHTLNEYGIEFVPHLAFFPALRIIFILMTLILIPLPWLLIRNPKTREQITKKTMWKMDKSLNMLFLGLAFYISPALYGLVLVGVGTSIIELYIFSAISIVLIGIWGAFCFWSVGKST
jgi:hypothetical protein